MNDLIGRKLGQYEILSLLGKGGMATVYRGRQASINRDVAVKVIDANASVDTDFVRRFEREAHTIASLSNAHILKVYDYGQVDQLVYLVMELLRGGSLGDLIRKGPIAPDLASQLLNQIASGLDAAHRRGIIHRDLKPANVLLDDDGNAFLSDFGIAKLLQDNSGLTQTGMTMGTPGYMAPEQWQTGIVDNRTDLYALGIMLFEMLTGRLPFVGDSAYHLMYKHLNELPPSALEFVSDLSPYVDDVIQKALQKDPNLRYQSAGEMASAFRKAIHHQPLASTTTPSTTGPAVDPYLNSSTASHSPRTPVIGTSKSTASTPSSSVPQEQPTIMDQGGMGSTMPPQMVLPVDAKAPRPSTKTGLIAALAVISVLLVGGFLILNRGMGQASATPSSTVVAQQPSATSPVLSTQQSMQTATAEQPTVTFTISATAVQPSTTATTTPTVTPSVTSTATSTPSNTPTITATATLTSTATNTATASTTATLTSTATNTATNTATATSTATFTPTATVTASATNTQAPTLTPTSEQPPLGFLHTGTFNVQQVWVPAGCFQMGSVPAQDGSAQAEEQPAHEVCLTQGYFIDAYEVTVASFQEFIDTGGYVDRQFWSNEGWAWKGDRTEPDIKADLTQPSLPRTNITWFEAEAYAKWRGGQLPTEAQWEYTARGPQSLLYPWGNAYDLSKLNAQNTLRHADVVGSYPDGKSWCGAYDMSGNVAEWVADYYSPTYYQLQERDDPKGPNTSQERVIRGGWWSSSAASTRSAYRFHAIPRGRDEKLGFRVVSFNIP